MQQLLILTQEELQLSSEDAETIRSEFLPRSVPLAHAYYALSWLCHCPAQTVSNSLVEQNIRAMTLLGFKKSQESYGKVKVCAIPFISINNIVLFFSGFAMQEFGRTISFFGWRQGGPRNGSSGRRCLRMDIVLAGCFPPLYESYRPAAMAHRKSCDFYGISNGTIPALGRAGICSLATELVCKILFI